MIIPVKNKITPKSKLNIIIHEVQHHPKCIKILQHAILHSLANKTPTIEIEIKPIKTQNNIINAS